MTIGLTLNEKAVFLIIHQLEVSTRTKGKSFQFQLSKGIAKNNAMEK